MNPDKMCTKFNTHSHQLATFISLNGIMNSKWQCRRMQEFALYSSMVSVTYKPLHTFNLLYPYIDHMLWTRTLLAHLLQPHLQPAPHLTPNVLTTLSCSDSISVSCRGNVSLRCFLITGTMRWNAATQPPYQQHNTQKPTQCHTSAHKLAIRLIQLIQLKLLPQCCLIGIHFIFCACQCVCHRTRHLTLPVVNCKDNKPFRVIWFFRATFSYWCV